MRIVDRTTFMGLPSGTVYSKYTPCYFEELSVKGDTLTNVGGTPIDWFYQQLVTPSFATATDSGQWMEQLDRMQSGESSPPLDFDFAGRDGCFDESELFAVWERADVAGLIARLQKALRDSDTQPKAGDAQQGSARE